MSRKNVWAGTIDSAIVPLIGAGIIAWFAGLGLTPLIVSVLSLVLLEDVFSRLNEIMR